MFAVVKTGGKQYKTNLGDIIEVEKLAGEAGDKVELACLAASNDIEGKTKVVAEIIEQKKDDKVLIFKKRRRKNSQRLNGHRQRLTAIRIIEIGGEKAPAQKKAKAETKAEPKKEAKKTEVKKESKPLAKEAKSSDKKAGTEKKPKAEKKAPAKKAATKKETKNEEK